MRRVRNWQAGFGIAEGLLVLAVLAGIMLASVWAVRNHDKTHKTAVTQSGKSTSQTSSTPPTSTTTTTNTATTHTAQEAVDFVQETYDGYLAALNRANNGYGSTYQTGSSAGSAPVAQVGLEAIKNNLSYDVYAKAAAVTQATPFSCTQQYVADKYTASLASSDQTSAIVAVSISNGSGLQTNGMKVTVDLASFKITAVTCPG